MALIVIIEKSNACVKNSELVAVLNTHFGGKLNLARVKLIAHFVCALCKVRSVCFSRLANAFDHKAALESYLRCIQRFIASFALDGDLGARPVFNLLPDNTYDRPHQLEVRRYGHQHIHARGGVQGGGLPTTAQNQAEKGQETWKKDHIDNEVRSRPFLELAVEHPEAN